MQANGSLVYVYYVQFVQQIYVRVQYGPCIDTLKCPSYHTLQKSLTFGMSSCLAQSIVDQHNHYILMFRVSDTTSLQNSFYDIANKCFKVNLSFRVFLFHASVSFIIALRLLVSAFIRIWQTSITHLRMSIRGLQYAIL